MSKIIIESTDKTDTQVDIEEKLLKAVSTLQQQRENKTFREPFLKKEKDKADKIIHSLFENMISEISKALKGEIV